MKVERDVNFQMSLTLENNGAYIYGWPKKGRSTRQGK